MLNFLLPDKVNQAVRAEQVRLLHHQGFTIQFLGIITALICVTLLWKVADHFMLLIWLLVMVVISLVRLSFTVKFIKSTLSEQDIIDKWGTGYVLGTLVSGITWGMLAFFYDPTWPAPYQVILFVVYTGITAGAFNTNTPLFIAFPAFYLPPVACLMVVMLKQRGEGFHELAALFMIYIILMYLSAIKFHNRLAKSLQIRFENEQLADMDELTGLYNRRSMDKYLASEWNRHYRSQKPLSLLFIDIDFFKQYNDTHGHAGGDQCLVEVSQLLKNNVQRSSDMVARFGGEEFAVILPETGEADAMQVAEKIHSGLTQLQIPHESSPVAAHVTMSVGVATMVPEQTDNSNLLLKMADEALYQAKNTGRDRVIKAEVH
ncbi:MAG: diguanylate cyclase [Thioalkalispiraceae bacterium]|jgi:diguanylate cyclase (GGDEF)-like protein